MKKLTIIALSFLVSLGAAAEGYQVNTLSARQVAMGHTGVAMKLGAESMYFNPAGLAFTNSTLDLSAGMTAIAATASAVNNGRQYTTKNKVSTPLYVYAGFSIYKNFKAGVAFYTPYGSGIDWTNNWPGSTLSQSVSLKAYVVQPTLSYRILPNLAVGAGLTLAWGNVDLSKGLVSGASMDKVLQMQGMPAAYGDLTPASVNLRGTADIAVGFNVGAMWDITNQITVGASFRSKMQMKVKAGDAKVQYVDDMAEKILESKLGLINNANFAASMPMPYTFTFGLSYRPTAKWEFALDAQLTGWGTYENLDIDFLAEKLAPFDQHIEKNYKNSWAVRFGAKYALTKRFDLRAGVNFDMTPVNELYYNPETPGMNKIAPSLGFSFRPFKGFSVDVACSYVHGLGKDGASCKSVDLLLTSLTGKPVVTEFKADYKVHAWTPSIGIGYAF